MQALDEAQALPAKVDEQCQEMDTMMEEDKELSRGLE